MANIGFVGLGHMGLPMAINLVKAGHAVIGFDLQASTLDQFAKAGGKIASSLQEVANKQEVIICMLQTGSQVLKVCDGAQGLMQAAAKGSLLIDCSTIDVQSARTLHELAEKHGLLVLDAPVSGGVASALAKTLTFIVGGEEASFGLAKPILACMGQKIIHTGGAGSGQAAKICNNHILGISMVAISEAFILAQELGLSADKLFEVVNNASGQCWAMSKYVPVPGILENVPANNNYKPGFASTMMLKDLLLSHQAATAAKVELPLGNKTTALYQQFVDEGSGNLDFSAIIQYLAQ